MKRKRKRRRAQPTSYDDNASWVLAFAAGRTPQVRRFSLVLMMTFLSLMIYVSIAHAETLSWNSRPATNLIGGSTDSATVNGVTIVTSGTRAGAFDGAGLNQHEIQPAATVDGYSGFVFSIFNGTADNESNSQTTTLSFSEPVYNVSFLVGDIDGGLTYNDGTNSFTDIIEFRANAGAVLPTSGTPVDASRVNWNGGTARATAISNLNVGDATGSITVNFAGPVNSLTIRHIGGDTALANPTQQGILIEDITFSRSPRLALAKTSIAAVGTFSFDITNGPSGNLATNITTVTSGTQVTGTQFRLGSANLATTVTETGPVGWAISATATCTDSNSANSGNPASFNTTVSGTAFTIPATNVRGAAELTCAVTNTKLPTLQLRKISNGGTGTFNFSGNNGFGSAAITTITPGAVASIAEHVLANFSTATTATEAIPADYFITATSCSGLGSGTATPNFAAGTVLLDAAATAPGNVIVCTYTNERVNPALSILKTASTGGPVSVGDIITYTYRVTNTGNQLISAVTIAETFNGTGTLPVPRNEFLLADNAPSGDSTDSAANNGLWTTLGPGDIVRFTAPYTVTQSDVDQLQ